MRRTQKHLSLFAALCWLLLTIMDCGAMVQSAPAAPDTGLNVAPVHHGAEAAHLDHAQMTGDMDCCDTQAISCCEPASLALPGKADEGQDYFDAPVAWSSQIPLSNRTVGPTVFAVVDNWRYHTLHPRIHLLHCSFLD